MLYTRRGDDGTTRTLTGEARVSKSSSIAEALGSLDEINSLLGLCKVEAEKWNYSLKVGSKEYRLSEIVHEVQESLFIIQAELAGADKRIHASKVKRLELYTDTIEKQLPPIKSFFISGGTELAARFDVARTVARRAERRAVLVCESHEGRLTKSSRTYMNRLSSLLYALARYSNFVYGVSEKAPTYS